MGVSNTTQLMMQFADGGIKPAGNKGENTQGI